MSVATSPTKAIAVDAATTPARAVKVVCVIEGGLVQGVLVDGPADVVVLDYDADNANDNEVTWVPDRSDETVYRALLGGTSVEHDPKRVRQLFNLYHGR